MPAAWWKNEATEWDTDAILEDVTVLTVILVLLLLLRWFIRWFWGIQGLQCDVRRLMQDVKLLMAVQAKQLQLPVIAPSLTSAPPPVRRPPAAPAAPLPARRPDAPSIVGKPVDRSNPSGKPEPEVNWRSLPSNWLL